jgi:hypothetical protein
MVLSLKTKFKFHPKEPSLPAWAIKQNKICRKLESKRKDEYAKIHGKSPNFRRIIDNPIVWAECEADSYLQDLDNLTEDTVVPTHHTSHVDGIVVYHNTCRTIKYTIECKYGCFNLSSQDWRFGSVLKKLFTDTTLKTIHPKCPDHLVLLNEYGYSDIKTFQLIRLIQNNKIKFDGSELRVSGSPTSPHKVEMSRLFWDNFVYYT